jgi:hypothetical protein
MNNKIFKMVILGRVLYLGSVFGFHSFVSTGLPVVKFHMLHTVAHVSGN